MNIIAISVSNQITSSEYEYIEFFIGSHLKIQQIVMFILISKEDYQNWQASKDNLLIYCMICCPGMMNMMALSSFSIQFCFIYIAQNHNRCHLTTLHR